MKDMLRDIVESRHDHDKLRSAARNHLQDYLAVMSKLKQQEAYCNQNIYNHNNGFCLCSECVKLKAMVDKIQEGLGDLMAEMSGELPESLLLSPGYNVDQAESGLYEDVKNRYQVFRSMSDYYTTMIKRSCNLECRMRILSSFKTHHWLMVMGNDPWN